MSAKVKDPFKQAIGAIGGKLSGGNFKNNINHARQAGKKSAWLRNSRQLKDYPLDYEEMVNIPTNQSEYFKAQENLDKAVKNLMYELSKAIGIIWLIEKLPFLELKDWVKEIHNGN